jgi:putative nucleotidyltransferase with HDIG domain
LYVQWGAVALLAAIVPIIGLRSSYGVNIELHQLSQDLLRVLIKTLEARDRYTSGHSVRVAERSKKIARMLRLGPRDVRVIETAALLHDIGKIDLAYGEILRQTGPLDPEQRQLIRAHPDKGVEIIQAVRSLDPEILRCVRHHHEWFDGSGYPAGISGEKIPLGARIIMISDSVDAMLTDRPYRAALSIEDVRQELVRNTGVQFDPAVVKAAFDAAILEDAESQLQLTISPGEPRAPAAN